MSAASESSGITDALAQALQIAKDGQRAQEEAGAATVEVEAAEGMVRVTATLAGKVAVEIVDPRAVRLSREYLGEEITAGVNAALDKAREQAGVPGAVDLDALTEKVEEIQQQSVQRLSSFMSTLAESHTRIVRTAAQSKGVDE
ncbi:YbaB/EbfC family nucleoid-associated protein [Glycomyces sp. A-F 0318]|uniref:YbaB/EbfC family nucleoid-associated protein n=1 Tax=Glycomyces amatae TaxID=2881355 RepID=UPI001E370B02|nr:YbaB/EbfC family nucleoid-associated protein [Glycomyces amatae]MCD0442521.1 YbaB/EbfC family nucleoid-associated protein [Glycomyces amatae]